MPASPLALLSLPPSAAGKNAMSSMSAAATAPHRADRQATEADADLATTDPNDTTANGPSFSQMLRERTAPAPAPVAREKTAPFGKASHDQRSASQSAAGGAERAEANLAATGKPEVAPETSEQLTAWLAGLMQGRTQGAAASSKGRTSVDNAQESTDDPAHASSAQTEDDGETAVTQSNPAESVIPVTPKAAPADIVQSNPTQASLTAAQAAPSVQDRPDRQALRITDAAVGTATRDPAPSPMRNARSLASDKALVSDGKPAKPGPSPAAREAAAAGMEATRAPLVANAPSSIPGDKPGNTSADTNPPSKPPVNRLGGADAAMTGLQAGAAAAAASAQFNAALNGATAGGVSATPVTDTAIAQDIRRPEFVPVFSARIATLVQEGVEQARVHLNPVEMGPVSLQLSLDGQQVRVDMTAEVAATRQVLEQALPALAGALREAGFTLSGGGVSQPGQDGSTPNGQDPRGASGSSGEQNSQASSDFTGLAGQQTDGRRPSDREPGRAQGSPVFDSTEGLTTELHLAADGTPRLAQGRGLVDTFA
jgi:flagellar hook-length control protein FliK